ncbi:ABC-type tungstate transport system, periplasmic component [Beggiatoa alba B18LD]|uniref:ABC-type tungstate transport system, periplasmic component n=1 Tax=Beggiatoa alba B18LD TaxID=395493 RepID=I3CBV0_9GAMM|nr:ABC transporter permease [Beggiatoa alba]EIJ41093.1 ABC-type tungstate transport system, periplasmic component [Beggiatoa alba B18LD]
MSSLSETILNALILLVSGDIDLWVIIWTSFKVSFIAIAIAIPPSLFIAFLLAFSHFPTRRLWIALFQVLLAFPAVVVGLLVYMLLSRQGWLGDLKLLFTQTAMVIAQICLSVPILVAMGHATFQSADRRAWETALTLGAKPYRAMFTLMYEVRFGLFAAGIAAFSRIIAEVGSSMMVGGNILHYTRNIPTAIALETSKGMFEQGIALGIVLLVLALLLNVSLIFLQGKGEMLS